MQKIRLVPNLMKYSHCVMQGLCNTDHTQTGKAGKMVTQSMTVTNDDMHVYLGISYSSVTCAIRISKNNNKTFQCVICSIAEDHDLTCNCFFQLLRSNFNTLCCLNFLVLHICILRIKNKHNQESSCLYRASMYD